MHKKLSNYYKYNIINTKDLLFELKFHIFLGPEKII